jgi:hypothetical protein
MMEEIYYDKIPVYRRQLLRVRRRLESTKKLPKVSVWPKVIIDLIYHPFTATQLAYLSRGNFEQNNLQFIWVHSVTLILKKIIHFRANLYTAKSKCILSKKKTQEKRINKELDDVMKKLKEKMSNSKNLPSIPLVSSLYKLYSDRLRACLTHSYMNTLPLRDQIRALRELKIAQSIRRKLIKYKLVLRETDKSGVLHIGRAVDYQRKAAEYRQKTGSYEELPSNPFNDIICIVTRLLNQLKATKKIQE